MRINWPTIILKLRDSLLLFLRKARKRKIKIRFEILRILIWEIIMIIIAILFLVSFDISKILNEPFQSYNSYYCFIGVLVLFLIIFPILMTILEKY
ncbi:hypothetical protein AMJ44_09040 [candidate division WOR-1 bacterium DG_54_3]|uniref:Uncharacterized protein n=1 Tax=candidate division WOR-1 bacterium DG_54_3 TaxID=1703775 RepID=A0A0S7XV09_UNCSA|nr:MAG: hypothetical protein AMJ44_09040 [candidate division WOR-1 bacterium DG_54_3]